MRFLREYLSILGCNYWVGNSTLEITITTFCILMIMLSGCGKSPDDLYAEGKAFLINDETFDKGVETLLLFEEKFPEDDRTPEVILAVASSYQSRKKYTTAIETFERLIEKYPDTVEAYKGMFLLGYMYYEDIKDQEKSETVLNKFIELYPDSELTISARVLIENIGLPLEEWSIIDNLEIITEK